MHEPYRATAADSYQVGGTHYASKAVQPWEAMEAWMSREAFAGFLRGNAIKYLARCDDKGGVLYIDTGAWASGEKDFALIDLATIEPAARQGEGVAA